VAIAYDWVGDRTEHAKHQVGKREKHGGSEPEDSKEADEFKHGQ
jgi:hypothetical protein